MFEEQIITTFGQWGVWVVVFICASLPIIEARVAIPLGCATAVWGSSAMSIFGSCMVACIGGTLAGLCVIITLSPIMKGLRKTKRGGKLVGGIEDFFADKISRFTSNNKTLPSSVPRLSKQKKSSNEITKNFNGVEKVSKKETGFSKKKKASTFRTMLLLMIFIALPIPLMGVYTGAGVGIFLKLKWWQNFLSVVIGNALSCVIIGLTCWVLYPFIPLLLTCLIIIVVLIISWYIISLCWNFNYKKHQRKPKKVTTAE